MDKTPFQSRISELLSTRPDKVRIGISEKELTVIIEIGDNDAAYTADEARAVAARIDREAEEEDWDTDIGPITNYINDLAAVVDNEIELEEVK